MAQAPKTSLSYRRLTAFILDREASTLAFRYLFDEPSAFKFSIGVCQWSNRVGSESVIGHDTKGCDSRRRILLTVQVLTRTIVRGDVCKSHAHIQVSVR
jgi:hypothetical protein